MTGGQFSLIRSALGLQLLVSFGAYLASRTLQLDAPTVCGVVGMVLALAVGLGWRTPATALASLIVLVILGFVDRDGTRDMSLLELLLLIVGCLPDKPYLSWDMRGRVDPAGDWALSHRLAGLVHLIHALSLVLGAGWLALETHHVDDSGPLAWAFVVAPYTLLFLATAIQSWRRRLGPRLWTLTLLALVMGLLGYTPLLPGLLVAHLFAFDRAWLPPRRAPGETATVFYDGHCALCHRTVRLLLAEDASGDAFVFAPLQGPTFPERVPADVRADLPDSVLVLTPDGRLLTRSTAAVEALARLGGAWRALGVALALVPRPLRDLGYDGVARIRKSIFGAPEATCPIIPAGLQARFLP